MNITKLQGEINTWEFLASGLDKEHQQNVKIEILAKVENLKAELKDAKSSKSSQKNKVVKLKAFMCAN